MTPRNVSIWILVFLAAAAVAAAADDAGKIPITTASTEARTLYLQGRDAGERLLGADSRELFAKAVAADPNFALAHFALANSANTAQEFFDEQKRAVALADRASKGERLLILAQDAGVRGDPTKQGELLSELVAAYPQDERAQMALGNYHFGRQDYDGAVACYHKAAAINPSFSQIYNQLGYAERFLGDYGAAETAFKKYIELIPNDPNPYDSYGELLIAMGRYTDSIAQYEKALSIDAHFPSSYVGIANDQMFMGHPAEARAALARLQKVARNDAERRQALFWIASTYVGEGDTAHALAAVQDEFDLAAGSHDLANQSADLVLMGQILLHARKTDEAAAKFTEAARLIDGADVPAGAKEGVHRNHLYFEARTALAKGDLAAAGAKAAEYEKAAEAKKIPFELRRVHELAGRIALAQKHYDRAEAELTAANQQDPEVVYALAQAVAGAGDAARAKPLFAKARAFTNLNFNYAYVRDAERMAKPKAAR
jgi:tetratricopeptide (TPR) repeat protein